VERDQSRPSSNLAPGQGLARPVFDRRELAAVFAGGCIGALVRSALARELAVGAGSWPWATFAVNIAGALLLGYLVSTFELEPSPAYSRPFLSSGICGALTTFSTLMVELLRMLEDGQTGLAAGYGSASIAAGLGAVWVATRLVRRRAGHRP
jgi:CrcB protein